ncbi:MAG: hypothetical protein AAFS10_14035 [Myxococcota bacterium]
MPRQPHTPPIRARLGRTLASMTRAMIDLLETLEGDAERMATTPRRSPPTRSPRRPSRSSPPSDTHRWIAMHHFMASLEQQHSTQLHFQHTSTPHQTLGLTLYCDGTLRTTHRPPHQAIRRNQGHWTLHPSGDGARLDVCLANGTRSALWIEPDRHRNGAIIVTITRGLFGFVNTFDTVYVEP